MLSRRACAATLAVTAAVHLAVVPEHQREWPAAAVFFMALAGAEAVLAVGVLSRPTRPVLVVGMVVSVASALLWITSRTIGLPFGPQPFSAEPAAPVDMFATALEAVTALTFLHIASHREALGVPAFARGSSRA